MRRFLSSLFCPLYAFLTVLYLASLVGCAVPVLATPRHWADLDRPVKVLVSQDMTPVCHEATEEALSWWEEQVDYLEVEWVPGYDPAVIGVPHVGEIGINHGALSPGIGGLTQWDTYGHTGYMVSASVTIADCKPLIVAHEIGHALGLDHNVDHDANGPNRPGWWQADFGIPGTLMCMGVECMGWKLLPAELEQIK
jgi:hypothetical protein